MVIGTRQQILAGLAVVMCGHCWYGQGTRYKRAPADSYIVKVISEADRRAGNLSQHVLDQLAHAIGHADWNGFLRTNPIPDGQFQQLLKAKFKKRLDALVEQRMADLRAEQAEDSEFRGNQ